MLSYQHGYHAGNLADVHKHIALVLLLRRLATKDKPFCYVDSHAGAGVYDLDGPEARKTREADSGVRSLAALAEPPEAVADYLGLVSDFNQPGLVRCYPGSPALARSLLREQDRAILIERHPQAVAELRRFSAGDARVSVHARDCFEGLPALLPPPIRRGLVLIDPSYEVKEEYETVVGLLARSFDRWSNGIFALWYPLLADGRHAGLLRKLAALNLPRTLGSEYRFADAGLQGSGLAIVNAPWRFEEGLRQAMEFIAAALPAAGGGRTEQRWMTPP